jgi:hypothetical protein
MISVDTSDFKWVQVVSKLKGGISAQQEGNLGSLRKN